jgi:hypothetical protein
MSQPTPLNFGFAGGSKYGQYYRHSGQINVAGVVAALIVGILAGAIMAVVYSGVVVFIPFVKLRGIACFFFGIGLGAVPAVLMRKLKVRSIPVSLAVVGVVTLLSFYISWASWEVMVLRDDPNAPSAARIMTNPKMVYDWACVINESGTWTIGGGSYSQNGSSSNDAEKGTFLLVIWGLEAAVIFGSSLVTVRKMLNNVPFCEKCEAWCTPRLIRKTALSDPRILKTKLEAGDFSYVAALPAPADGQTLDFTRHRCETCKEMNTLSVLSRQITKDKKGRVRTNKTRTIINKLLVSSEDMEKLMPPTPAVAGVTPAALLPTTVAPARKPIQSPQALK